MSDIRSSRERARHNALVLDFGGGTFDVCIVSTTKEGDISQSGRNAKPLAADSTPVGGFAINRLIAQELLKRATKPGDPVPKKALDAYHSWQTNKVRLEHLDAKYQQFAYHLDRVAHNVEDAKLALCKMIRNWALEAPLTLSVPCEVPENPFVEDTHFSTGQDTAAELRTLFVSEIWPKRRSQLSNAQFDGHKTN